MNGSFWTVNLVKYFRFGAYFRLRNLYLVKLDLLIFYFDIVKLTDSDAGLTPIEGDRADHPTLSAIREITFDQGQNAKLGNRHQIHPPP